MRNSIKQLLAICLTVSIFLAPTQGAWAQAAGEAPKNAADVLAVNDPQKIEQFRNRLIAYREQEKKRPVVALVLGGGGARGAAHVGVLKVLEKEDIPVDMVVGTSIGSIVGGLYCAGVPIEKIEQEFRSARLMKHFMTVPLFVRILVAPIMVMPRLVWHPYDGLYVGGKFRRYLNHLLPDQEKNIEDLKIPFDAVATNLTDGTIHTITEGNVARAMQASSAVPGLRKPVEIGDNLFCDGAMLENVPVMQARKLGADVVIAVNIDENFDKLPKDHFRKMGSVYKRIVVMQLYRMDKPSVDQACVSIHPDTTGISLISRSKKDASKGIEAGEEAAKKALPRLKSRLAKCGINI